MNCPCHMDSWEEIQQHPDFGDLMRDVEIGTIAPHSLGVAREIHQSPTNQKEHDAARAALEEK